MLSAVMEEGELSRSRSRSSTSSGPPLLGAGAGAGQGLYPGLGPDLDQGVVSDPGVDGGQGGILGTVRQPRLL